LISAAQRDSHSTGAVEARVLLRTRVLRRCVEPTQILQQVINTTHVILKLKNETPANNYT